MIRVVFDLSKIALAISAMERLTTFGVDPDQDKKIQELEDMLKKATPGYPNGRVWRDWETRKSLTTKGSTIDIINPNPAAFYLEYGTAPHPINPHRPPYALHITTPGWDGPEFLPYVKKHPGTRPTLFATKTWIRWASANRDLGSFVRVRVGDTYVG